MANWRQVNKGTKWPLTFCRLCRFSLMVRFSDHLLVPKFGPQLDRIDRALGISACYTAVLVEISVGLYKCSTYPNHHPRTLSPTFSMRAPMQKLCYWKIKCCNMCKINMSATISDPRLHVDVNFGIYGG